MTRSPAARAFTLVELIVTLAIVGALAALAVPVYSRVSQSGKAASCISNLRQIGAALNLYLGEHSQIMPHLAAGRHSLSENIPVLDNTFNAYTQNQQVFACPADNKNLAANTGTSYYWNVALNDQSVTNLHFLLISAGSSQIPIASDKEAFHPYTANKVNLLYADGHATQDLQFATSP